MLSFNSDVEYKIVVDGDVYASLVFPEKMKKKHRTEYFEFEHVCSLLQKANIDFKIVIEKKQR